MIRRSDGDVDVAGVARLIGEPTRAAMLDALMSGKALTAGELARVADVTAATASEHLSRLRDGGLVQCVAAGRHRYFRLASADVAHAVEALSTVARPVPVTSLRQSRNLAAMHTARTCYDHLAGRIGVGIYRSLLDSRSLVLSSEGLELTDSGESRLNDLGVDVRQARGKRRVFARSCLDATVRREHLAGALGAQICLRLIDLAWLRPRGAGQRGLRVTDYGGRQLAEFFGIDL